VGSQELAVQLELARKRVARYKELHARNVIAKEEIEEAEGSARLLEGRIADRVEQLEEERELLKVRLEAKRAELDGATAQIEVAKATLAIVQVHYKSARAPSEEVQRAQAELRREETARAICAAEVRGLEVRIRQVERRLIKFTRLLDGPNRPQKPGAPAPAPPPPPPPGG
jgi:hypothetical protein